MANGIGEIGRKVPLLRGLFMQSPPYLHGSVTENRLGMQVARTLGKHLARKFRPAFDAGSAGQYAFSLDRDGIVEIPNFLPPGQFAEVRAEYERLRTGMEFRQFRDREGRMVVARLTLHDKPARAPKFNDLIGNSAVIRGLASYVAKVPASRPHLELTIYKAVRLDLDDNDDENLLHADLHSPTLKCFYYLNDVTAENGAFIYAKGSARLTMQRLRYEYDLSVRTARLRRGDRDFSAAIARRGSVLRAIVSPEQREDLGIVETQFPVKANTLVAANNMGFHRRGEFTC